MNDLPPDAPETAPAPRGARVRVHRFRVGLFARLKAYFFAGVLVTAPIAITAAVAIWFINLVDAQIVPLIPEQWNPDTYLREHVGLNVGLPGLGLLVLVAAITLIGAFAAGLVGRIVVRAGDSVLARMPVIRTVYGASKQILETVLRNQSNAFRQAVMIEYPRRGLWTIGFITGETQGEVQSLTDDKVYNVFVPTTPNPTSGFLLFVPERDIVILTMTVEEAVKLIISGGIVAPPERPATAAAGRQPKRAVSRTEA
ncbi:MAG: DUF502 domain-containing protein [Alphaproteobacteria bacterium]